MKILVTGSAGHLGEALMRTLRAGGHEAIGLDRLYSPYTDRVGCITERALVKRCLKGAHAVLHAATLHKPHVATHPRQAFIDVNLSGTLVLLEEAAAAGVGAFVFTSTTSTFGHALTPPAGQPAAWITEDVVPVPKNIYGVTKVAAEDLCEIMHRSTGMPCVVLRTSRFFPEPDDDPAKRAAYPDDSLKVSEYLYRRADIEDVVSAHLLTMARAPAIGFGRYIISATTPFEPGDLAQLRTDAAGVLRHRVPGYEAVYAQRGWTLPPGIERVYVNARARAELGWQPRHDFAGVIQRLQAGQDFRSELAVAIGSKGYHRQSLAVGPYPVI